ncbi:MULTISPECIES: DUF4835 family protein [Chryseobacterium group]|uniref:type IX secretion system protein PorD n=1 Tax=Chryseobacterium group TaxID=2782232 RepID=UPI0012A91972|nr:MULTISPECIES: DUF4835 family protein [Chryseobacterium group]MDF0719010.1 DUF4835 family protein [Kaistella sp. PBT33-4]QFG54183.1 DUF4835 family protein [Chryseobacterium sp.]
MKNFLSIFILLLFSGSAFAQEIMANVTVNAQQLSGSNQQVYRTLEKNVRDFINKTSWTGKRLQNFEKVKSNFAFVITGREGNRFNGTLVVQAVRPVFNSTYESPLMNVNDTKIDFEYVENENLIFNERQFSGKNLTDIISFYVYLILGYDADSFQSMGGQPHFTKAQQISRNAMNKGYEGWSVVEGPRTRGALIDGIIAPSYNPVRIVFYNYHRSGLDNMYNQDQSSPKKVIADALMALRQFENSFQQNYAINLFLDTKAAEIYNIFDSRNNGAVNMNDLKQLMITLSPKNTEARWNNWK